MMIKIVKSRTCWNMFVDSFSEFPFVYDDINLLLEDLSFIMESYNND